MRTVRAVHGGGRRTALRPNHADRFDSTDLSWLVSEAHSVLDAARARR